MFHMESKQEFYRLSRKLLLGNILRQWTWAEFSAKYAASSSELPKIIGVRHVRQAFTNKGNSRLMPLDEAFRYGYAVEDKRDLLFDEGAIHDRLTIQGEVCASERGLDLRYSHLKCHQRTLWHIAANGCAGLEEYQLPHNLEDFPAHQMMSGVGVVKYENGLRASAVLQTYMDTPSWEKLSQILGCQIEDWLVEDEDLNFAYPIVEFACFDRTIGVLGWNTLFWEIRTRY
jgi:hypothetical protein